MGDTREERQQTKAAHKKKDWAEPDFNKLTAEETAGGSGGFDEDADIKTGS